MVEIELEPVERQEHADVGDGDDEDDRQRLPQRVEQDAGGEEDDGDDEEEQEVLPLVLLVPAPIGVLALGGVAHGERAVELSQDALLYLVALRARPDVLVLQAEAVLLVHLGDFLRRLPPLDGRQVGQFVASLLRGVGHLAQAPDIVVARLRRGEAQPLALVVHHDRAGLYVFPEYGADRVEQLDGPDMGARHALLVEVEVKLLVVVFPPRELGADLHLLDAPVGEQLLAQLPRPLVQLVVVVAVHYDAERAGVLAHVVAEPLVHQSPHAPASAAQLQRLADDAALERVREAAPLALAGEVDVDKRLAGVVDTRLELADFLVRAQVALHAADEVVHLFEGRPVGHRGADAEHGLLAAGEIAALVHFLDEEAQRAAQRLVDDGLDGLFPCLFRGELVVSLNPERVGGGQLGVLVRLYLLRQEEDRQAEHERQEHACPRPPAV